MKKPLIILFIATLTVSLFGQKENNQIELIKIKMTKEAVIKIMGQPAFINFDNSEETWTKATKEIWLYGAECQKCYAKYGSIYFDSSGLVQYVYDNKIGNDGITGHADTIIIENIVKFYKYNDENNSNVDAIDYILKVTNHTKRPIPDLGVINRSKYVNLYINGQIDNPLSLFNGLESTEGIKTIAIDSTQTFDSGGWLINADSGLLMKYGNEFTVQWEYMKIKSNIIKVNIKNNTTEAIDQ